MWEEWTRAILAANHNAGASSSFTTIKLSPAGTLCFGGITEISPERCEREIDTGDRFPFPDGEHLGRIFEEAARSAKTGAGDYRKARFVSSKANYWSEDSSLGIALAVLDDLGVGFYCKQCCKKRSMTNVVQAVHDIEKIRNQLEVLGRGGVSSEKNLHALQRMYEIVCSNIHAADFCVVDIGTRVCVALLNSQR